MGCCTPRRAMSAARSSIPSGEGRPRGLVFDGKMLSTGILNISPATAGCVAMGGPFSPARNGLGPRFWSRPIELGGNVVGGVSGALSRRLDRSIERHLGGVLAKQRFLLRQQIGKKRQVIAPAFRSPVGAINQTEEGMRVVRVLKDADNSR